MKLNVYRVRPLNDVWQMIIVETSAKAAKRRFFAESPVDVEWIEIRVTRLWDVVLPPEIRKPCAFSGCKDWNCAYWDHSECPGECNVRHDFALCGVLRDCSEYIIREDCETA